MKRWLSLAMVLTLVLVVAVGCSSGGSYKDGQYDAESEVDDHGYKSVINISVKDGKIDKVDYEELSEDGEKKSEDENYAGMMEGASGVTPASAYEQLENSLVKSQDPDKVDAVTGATGSSETFKKLAKEALDKAK